MPQTPRLTRAAATAMLAEQQALYDRVRPLLKPSTAAEIQERLWEMATSLEACVQSDAPPPAPTVVRPRTLPQALNPFYFARRRGAADSAAEQP